MRRIASRIVRRLRGPSTPTSADAVLAFDGPARGEVLEPGAVRVHGWGTVGRGLPAGVRVTLEGSDPVDATLGVQRPDVAAHLAVSGVDGFGWEALLEIADEGPATAVITVEAFDARGARVGLETRACAVVPPATVPADAPVGFLDLPFDGQAVHDAVLHIKGWVLFPGSRLARAFVVCDGVDVARMRPHLGRVDVADSFPSTVDGPVAGVEHHLALRDLVRRGSVDVSIRAEALDGRYWQSAASRVFLEAPPALDLDGDGAARREAAMQSVASVRADEDASGVLVCTHSLALGGGQLWLSDLLEQVHAQPGLQCTVVSFTDGPLRLELEEAGMHVHVCGYPPVDSVVGYESWVHSLALFVRSTGCRTAIVNTLGMFGGVEAVLSADLPVLWAIHESFDPDIFLYLNYGTDGAHPYVRQRLAVALERANGLVFEAQLTSDLFAEYAEDDRRIVVDYGIDMTRFHTPTKSGERDRLRSEAGFSDQDTVVLVMGVFEPRKAQASTVAAFDELASAHPDLHLVLVGAHPSDYAHAIRLQVARMEHHDRVTILDVTPDIDRWYELTDLFLCASDVESLPRSVMEAMAHRLPVLSTGIFGLPDLIEDGVTGWLFPDRDVGALAGALHHVLRLGAEARSSVAEAAFEQVRDRRSRAGYGTAFADALRVLEAAPEADAKTAFATYIGERQGALG